MKKIAGITDMKFKILGLLGKLLVNSGLKMSKVRLKRHMMIYIRPFYAQLLRLIKISLLD